VGCCDHDNGGVREYTWWISQKFTDAYMLAGKFVPMYYYERSVAYPEGHRNIIFPNRGVRPLPRLPVTSPTSPWSTSCMNCENAISFSFAPAPPACTTFQSRTPESRITSQNATVLTVEFTLDCS